MHLVRLVTVPQGKIAYVYARDGESLAPSQTLGRVVPACNDFQDARAFLVGEQPLPAAEGRVVVEVLEGVTADEEVLAGVRELRARGYRIAVDDWEGGDDRAALVACADFVKVDLEARGLVERLPGSGPQRVRLTRAWDEDLRHVQGSRSS